MGHALTRAPQQMATNESTSLIGVQVVQRRGKPQIDTVFKVLAALGLELKVEVK
jgi:DNA-binding phage protein